MLLRNLNLLGAQRFHDGGKACCKPRNGVPGLETISKVVYLAMNDKILAKLIKEHHHVDLFVVMGMDELDSTNISQLFTVVKVF